MFQRLHTSAAATYHPDYKGAEGVIACVSFCPFIFKTYTQKA